MRKTFATLVSDELQHNKDIVVVTGDLGYKMWDNVRTLHPNNFHNAGSAEQLLVGIGIGLALSNKIPLLYSITPFLLYRPFELIRNYINYESIPVKLIGSGRNKDYHDDGISHWADDDKDILSNFPNIIKYYPDDINHMIECFNDFMYNKKPCYMNLRR